MTLSQNGWTAYSDTSHFVRGEACGFPFWAANADVAVLFEDYIDWYDREIEPVEGPTLDDWSYANRLVRGSTSTVSNHGSATAIDVNALKHPRGVRGTFTPAQRRAIEARIGTYGGALRSGEFYTTTIDGMHVEIDTDKAGAKRAADKIRARIRAEKAAREMAELKIDPDDSGQWPHHELTEADAESLDGDQKRKGLPVAWSALLRFPPAVARLRREVLAGFKASAKSAEITGLAGDVAQLQADIAALRTVLESRLPAPNAGK